MPKDTNKPEDIYDVSFGEVVITKNGEAFFDSSKLKYSNTNYAVAVAVQQLVLEVLNRLGDAGVISAVEKGMKKQLELLGVETKR